MGAVANARFALRAAGGFTAQSVVARTVMSNPSETKVSDWGYWNEQAGRFTADRPLVTEVVGPAAGPYNRVELNTYCGGSPNSGICVALVQASRIELTLDDPTPPTGRASGLPAPGSTVRGVIELAASARDVGAGVREIRVMADDAIVAAAPLRGAGAACSDAVPGGNPNEYTVAVPCPLEGETELAVDTTVLAEGPTTLRVLAVDAAGNTTPLAEPVGVTIDNLDPYSEDLRAAGAIQCGVDQTGRWFNPGYAAQASENGSPATGAAGLTGSFPVARTVRKGRKRVRVTKYAQVRTVGYESSPTITGRLQTADGKPIAGATVYLAQRRAGGQWSLCDSPTGQTTNTGSYRIRAAARGADREVVALYFPHQDANAVVAGRTLQLRVRSGVQMTRPARSVRRGRTVTFRGRAHGEQIGALLVTLQVQMAGRGWRDFTTVRTRPDGTYSKRWRFRTGGMRYRIRAVIKRQAGRPYQLGYSQAHNIRVR